MSKHSMKLFLFSLLLLLHVSFINCEHRSANVKSKMDRLRGFHAKPLPGGGLRIRRLGKKDIGSATTASSGLEATTAAGGGTDASPGLEMTTAAGGNAASPRLEVTTAAGVGTAASPGLEMTTAAGGGTAASPELEVTTVAGGATTTAPVLGVMTSAAGATTAAPPVEGPPLIDGCAVPYPVVIGDSCASIANGFNLDIDTFQAINPELDCDALRALGVGFMVCVVAA
jgi:hypothetical protein